MSSTDPKRLFAHLTYGTSGLFHWQKLTRICYVMQSLLLMNRPTFLHIFDYKLIISSERIIENIIILENEKLLFEVTLFSLFWRTFNRQLFSISIINVGNVCQKRDKKNNYGFLSSAADFRLVIKGWESFYIKWFMKKTSNFIRRLWDSKNTERRIL